MMIRKHVFATLSLLVCLAVALLVAAPAFAALPDLVVKSATVKTATVAPGSRIAVASTVKNIGAAAAGRSTVRFYLSLDTKRSAGDIRLGGSRAVGTLAPGQSSSGTVKVKVPDTCTPRLYYVIAVADDLKRVRESRESNNALKASGRSQVMGPPFVAAGADPIGATKSEVSWSTYRSTAATYNVYRSTTAAPAVQPSLSDASRAVARAAAGELVYSASGAVTSFVDKGLAPGTTYYYTVESVLGSGSSLFSEQSTVSTTPVPTFPAPPTGFRAAYGGGVVTLQWDAYTGATQYELYRSNIADIPAGSGFSTFVKGGTFTTTTTDVPAGTGRYSYALYVYNGDGSQNAYALASVDVPADASQGIEKPVLDVWSTAHDTSVAYVYWYAAPGADAHHVYAAPQTTPGVVPPITPKQGGTSAPLAFAVREVNAGYYGMRIPLSSLTSGKKWYFAVEAVKGTYAADSASIGFPVVAHGSVGVTGVTASPRNPTKVRVTWTATAGATSYNVYALTSPTAPTDPAHKVGSTTGTKLDVAGLTPDLRYYFRVAAVSSGAEGAASNAAMAKTFSAQSPVPFVIQFGALRGWVWLNFFTFNNGTAVRIYGGASLNYTTIDPNHLVLQEVPTSDVSIYTGTAYPWKKVKVFAPASDYSVYLGTLGRSAVFGRYWVSEVYPDGTESGRAAWLMFPFL